MTPPPALEARYRYTGSAIPSIPVCNSFDSCPLSVVHINLPAGQFMLTFGIFINNGNSFVLQDNSRRITCWPTGAGPFALDGIDLKLPGSESRTSSWTTTRSGPGQIDVFCASVFGPPDGTSSGVSVYEAKISAIQVGSVTRQDGP